jgi:hypothetical protein
MDRASDRGQVGDVTRDEWRARGSSRGRQLRFLREMVALRDAVARDFCRRGSEGCAEAFESLSIMGMREWLVLRCLLDGSPLDVESAEFAEVAEREGRFLSRLSFDERSGAWRLPDRE